MRIEDFVATLRAECMDALVAYYITLFSETPSDQHSDDDMHRLGRFWNSADPETRAMIGGFMRLSSQNTLASVLAVLDNTSSPFQEAFHLVSTSSSGVETELSQDLLDEFWAQEEVDGRVNRR